jgi:hypothetical protein
MIFTYIVESKCLKKTNHPRMPPCLNFMFMVYANNLFKIITVNAAAMNHGEKKLYGIKTREAVHEV